MCVAGQSVDTYFLCFCLNIPQGIMRKVCTLILKNNDINTVNHGTSAKASPFHALSILASVLVLISETLEYIVYLLFTNLTTRGSWKKRARRDPCKTTRPIHLVTLFTDCSNTSNL